MLYTGVTSDIVARTLAHRDGTGSEYTAKYRIHRLVHVEEYPTAEEAILREKQIKGWLRAKKVMLIEENNPAWDDLSEDW
jgi:putative endonuclease